MTVGHYILWLWEKLGISFFSVIDAVYLLLSIKGFSVQFIVPVAINIYPLEVNPEFCVKSVFDPF